MSFASVCEAWATELVTHIDALADAKVHLYAPWSVENLYAAKGERHLAIWPEADPVSTNPFATGSLPSDLEERRFVIAVWELAAQDVARRMDDDAANLAWLDLAEDIQGRLQVQANTSLGGSGMQTRFDGVTWDVIALYRSMVVRFHVRFPRSYT